MCRTSVTRVVMIFNSRVLERAFSLVSRHPVQMQGQNQNKQQTTAGFNGWIPSSTTTNRIKNEKAPKKICGVFQHSRVVRIWKIFPHRNSYINREYHCEWGFRILNFDRYIVHSEDQLCTMTATYWSWHAFTSNRFLVKCSRMYFRVSFDAFWLPLRFNVSVEYCAH